MPFTTEQFFEVFSNYNSTLGWSVWLFYALALGVLFLVYSRNPRASKVAVGFLGFLWLWMGAVYHGYFFRSINPIAPAFAVLFSAQGALFLAYAYKQRVVLSEKSDPIRFTLSLTLILYALLIYPLLGALFGHGYPAGPIFGLPCPTAIFTFAILIVLDGPMKSLATLHAIPVIWALIGTSAAKSFGVVEDYGLLVSAIASLGMLVRHSMNRSISDPREA